VLERGPSLGLDANRLRTALPGGQDGALITLGGDDPGRAQVEAGSAYGWTVVLPIVV